MCIMHAIAHIIQRHVPIMIEKDAVSFISHRRIVMFGDTRLDKNQIVAVIILLDTQRIEIMFIKPVCCVLNLLQILL